MLLLSLLRVVTNDKCAALGKVNQTCILWHCSLAEGRPLQSGRRPPTHRMHMLSQRCMHTKGAIRHGPLLHTRDNSTQQLYARGEPHSTAHATTTAQGTGLE